MDKLLDPLWRLEHLYYVVNKKGKRVQLTLNNVQKRILANKSNRKIILKARQMGVSTLELIRQFDFTMFNENVTACILAHEDDAIAKLFRIPRRAYEYIDPSFEKTPLDRGGGSKYEMYFPEINSRIYCDLESRGDTIHWLHVSERAFIKEPDRVLATLESVPLDGIITFESTPNGLNDFYDMWMDLDSNYEKLFFPWYIHEEYQLTNHDIGKNYLQDDEKKLIIIAKEKYDIDLSLDQIAFRRFKQRELKNKFKQEYPEDDATCFLTSGQNPFTLEIIKPIYDKAPKPIREVSGIRIYEERQDGELYVVGGDTAEGIGGDRSAAHVFKVSTRMQVASFHSPNIKPGDFGDKLVEMAEMYYCKFKYQNQFLPTIGVERNNHGHAVILKLDEVLKYPNLFKHDMDSDKIGWITDKVTRPIMINALIESVENGTTKLVDRETLGECLTLVNNEGKIEAEEGKKDDLFIAACISVQLCIEENPAILYPETVKSLVRI